MGKKLFRAYNGNLRGFSSYMMVDGVCCATHIILHKPTGKFYRFLRCIGKKRENLRLVCEGPIAEPLDHILGIYRWN